MLQKKERRKQKKKTHTHAKFGWGQKLLSVKMCMFKLVISLAHSLIVTRPFITVKKFTPPAGLGPGTARFTCKRLTH